MKRIFGVVNITLIMMILLIALPGCSKGKEKNLIVYSLYSNNTIEEAINYFRNKENVKIKYECGIDRRRPISVSEAISNLNAELMSGEGPDIIVLDGLPINTYIDKGILGDISGAVNKHKNSLFQNVYEAYCNDDGAIYSFPMNMQIPVIISSKKDASKINNLESFTEAIKDSFNSNEKDILNIIKPREIINLLYYSCKDSWINDDKSLNEENFKEFIYCVKDIYKASTLSISNRVKKRHDEDYNYSLEYNKEEEYYEDYLEVHNMSLNLCWGRVKYDIGNLFEVKEFSSLDSYKVADDNINYDFWKGQGESYLVPKNSVGMNTNSKNKALSKEFISFLLDERYEVNSNFLFISTNRIIEERRINIENSDDYGVVEAFKFYNENDKATEYKIPKVSIEKMNEYLTRIEGIENCIDTDLRILDIVSKDIEEYILEKDSIENTVNEVKENIRVYLSE